MRQGKKISVIIPVYNTEKYIERCIYSLLKQTYRDIEIICVDDGSSDRSGEILDRLTGEDDRIRVFHKVNEGVSAARNMALLAAEGEYIGFVDSDDYVAANYYEELLNALEDGHADIATCSYYFDYDGDIVRAENKEIVFEEPMGIEKFFSYMYERDVYKGVGGYLWTKLVKKEIIKNNDGSLKKYFKKEYGGADDIVFVAEICMACKSIRYINKPLYYYFQREGSIVHNDSKQLRVLSWAEAYEHIIRKYKDYGIENDNLDILRRMYVYRCGKLLETAIQLHNDEKINLLQEKIRSELLAYIKTNISHLERVQWILDLLFYKAEGESYEITTGYENN